MLTPKPPRITGVAALKDRRLLRLLILSLCWRGDGEVDWGAMNIAARCQVSSFAEHYGIPAERVIAAIEAVYPEPTGTRH